MVIDRYTIYSSQWRFFQVSFQICELHEFFELLKKNFRFFHLCFFTLIDFSFLYGFYNGIINFAGITTVLTLSTISLDSRIDLPKVRYATALDWFLLMSFGYCIATLLEFAGVHYFTKVTIIAILYSVPEIVLEIAGNSAYLSEYAFYRDTCR